MKYLIALLVIGLASCAPQKKYPQLENARQACMAVQAGTYEMTFRFKPMTKPDTTISYHQTAFQKEMKDPSFGATFLTTKELPAKSYRVNWLYTGDELVIFPQEDSTAEYISATIWRKYINRISHNCEFFPPFIHPKGAPIPTQKHLRKFQTILLIGEESIQGQTLQHWRLESPVAKVDTSEPIATIKTTYDLWLHPQTSLPIKIGETYDLWAFGDTAIQYSEWQLTKHNLAPHTNPDQITIAAIPAQYPLKNYQPEDQIQLLAPGNKAPAFSHPTLDGGQLSLSDLKGKYVLIDFFYRSCYPCMSALPHLIKFNQQYKDRNVVVIGIDPYDQATPELKQFLQNRGVDYPVLLQAKETVAAYHISGYPTLYFIGPDGKILENENGYSPGSEAEWDKWVEKHVK